MATPEDEEQIEKPSPGSPLGRMETELQELNRLNEEIEAINAQVLELDERRNAILAERMVRTGRVQMLQDLLRELSAEEADEEPDDPDA